MQFSEVVLDKIKVAAMQTLSPDFMDAAISQMPDLIGNRLALQLNAYVFGEKGDDLVIDYPRDWWEAFKNRWFPRWALRRWPVMYTRHRITPQTIYQNLKISLPREMHQVRFIQQRTDSYSPLESWEG